MTRPELKLQTMVDVFKQALISFRANIRVLLVIAALSSMYNNAIESSIGLVGLSFNVSHGNFSLEFDHRGKQNHNWKRNELASHRIQHLQERMGSE